MRIRRFLIALLVVLGIVLSPLLAAAMIPALFVYDVAAPPAATVRIDVGRSLRPERGFASEYAYDAVHRLRRCQPRVTHAPSLQRNRQGPHDSFPLVRWAHPVLRWRARRRERASHRCSA